MAHETSPSPSPSRRRVLKAAGAGLAAGIAPFQIMPSRAWGANSRLTLAGIGSGGKGRVDIRQSANAGFQVVALVDVVDVRKMPEIRGRFKSMQETRDGFADARFFTDYREMIEAMGDQVDAVTVSTPDHHHFHAAYYAMQAGKHVYVQKPLTHSIWEARTLTELAAEKGLKTQMGNQAHAKDHFRRTIELVRAGLIGEIREIHAWTNRPVWPQGFSAPPEPEPVPASLDWEQWIGPAPFVPYSHFIAPFNWRGWWHYGMGALGDMACHIMDMPYWALELGPPKSVRCKQVGATKLSPPIHSTITYEFEKGPKFTWYEGQRGAEFVRDPWRLKPGDYNRPGKEILGNVDYRQFESVLVGERGKLFFNRKQDKAFVEPSSVLDGFEWPDRSLPRSPGHYREWVDAIEGKIDEAASSFGLAGPFTEMVLLGTLAQRRPDETLEWDAPGMKIKGRPELQSMIRREYREGWEIGDA